MRSPTRNRSRTRSSSRRSNNNNNNNNSGIRKPICDCCKQAFVTGPMKLFSFNALPSSAGNSTRSDAPLMSTKKEYRKGGLLQVKSCSKTACTTSSSTISCKMKKSPTAGKKKRTKKAKNDNAASPTQPETLQEGENEDKEDSNHVITLNSENSPGSVRSISDGNSSKASNSTTDELKKLVVAPPTPNDKNSKRNQEPIQVDERAWKTSIRDMLRGEEFLPPLASDQEDGQRLFDPFHIFPDHHDWQMSSSSAATSIATSTRGIMATAPPSPYRTNTTTTSTNNNLNYQYYYHHQYHYDSQHQSSSTISANMPDLQSSTTGTETDLMTTSSLETLRLKSLHSVEKSRRRQQQEEHHYQSSLSSSRTFLLEEDDTDDDFMATATRLNQSYPIFRSTQHRQQQYPYHFHEATTAAVELENGVIGRNYFHSSDVEDNRLHRQPRGVSIPPNPRDTYYKRFLETAARESLDGRGMHGTDNENVNYSCNDITTDTETSPHNTDTDTPPTNNRMRSKSSPPPQTEYQKEQEKLLLIDKERRSRRRKKKHHRHHRSKEEKKKHHKKKKKKADKVNKDRDEDDPEINNDEEDKKKKRSSRSKSKPKKSRSKSKRRSKSKTDKKKKSSSDKQKRRQRRHASSTHRSRLPPPCQTIDLNESDKETDQDDVSALTGPPPYNRIECEGSVDGAVSALTENSGFPPMVMQSNNKLAPRRSHDRPNIRSLMQLTQVLESPEAPASTSGAESTTPQTPTVKPTTTTATATQNDNHDSDDDQNNCKDANVATAENTSTLEVDDNAATLKTDG